METAGNSWRRKGRSDTVGNVWDREEEEEKVTKNRIQSRVTGSVTMMYR
jgi:hypothetical protein